LQTLAKAEKTEELTKKLEKFKLSPDETNQGLEGLNTALIKEKITVEKLLKRPNIGLQDIIGISDSLKEETSEYSDAVKEQTEILIKYKSYIDKERQTVEKISSMEDLQIPASIEYMNMKALSAEGRQKLAKIQPQTVGQASRISGVSPADMSILTIYLGK